MGVRLAWAAAACLVAVWVATRAAAAGELRRLAQEAPAATAQGPAAESLQARVSALQDRLLADRARVRFWLELQRRHEGVTAVTCSNLASHVEAMAQIERAARPARAAAEPKRRRLAVAGVGTHSD